MTEIRDIEVSDIPQLLDAMLRASDIFGGIKPWWRGHSVVDWDLLPAVHRKGQRASERNLTFRFKNMAKARHPKCPDNADLQGWLFLMQHYRLPTRLLDWSESPLVALFFVVEDSRHDNKDGALWALSPTRLNKTQRGEGVIFAADHPSVLPLFREAYTPVDKPTEEVLSVLTDQIDPRQWIQQSVFTIHGTTAPMNHLPGCADFLVRVRIPGNAKGRFRQIIDLLGVSRAILFPDLENLAADLCGRGFLRDA